MRNSNHSSHPSWNHEASSPASGSQGELRNSDPGSSSSLSSSAASILVPETRDAYRARRQGDFVADAPPRPGDSAAAAFADPQPATADRRPVDVANQMIDQLTRSLQNKKGTPQSTAPAAEPVAPAPTSAPAAVEPPPAEAPMMCEGDYEILRELGRSDSSVVYEAYDRTLRRYVAIKQLNETLRADPRQSELFWHEARFLAGFVHENVCRVYTVNEQQAWIVMEMMNGSLDSRLAEGPLSSDLVRSILRQALKGLKYLHEHGKLHGEIKPSKLLLDDEGCVKLSASAGYSMGGEFRRPSGMQKYVAPELLRPEVFGDIGPGADFYCLGLTALELLLGDRFPTAFKGVQDANDDLAWMRWHSSEGAQLPPLEQLVPNLPPDLATTLSRMLAKKVGDRYETADAALKDLDERPLVLVDVPKEDHNPSAPPEKKPAAVQIGAPPAASATPWPTKKEVKPKTFSEKLAQLADPEFLNKQSKNPKVTYPILAVIILAMFFVTSGRSGKKQEVNIVKVAVATTPAAAQLFLDDKPLGVKSPQSIELEPGTYKVRAELNGYKPAEQSFDVKADSESLQVQLNLEKMPEPPKPDDYQQPPVKPVVAQVDEAPKLPKTPQPRPDRQDETAQSQEEPKPAPVTPAEKTLGSDAVADFATYAPRFFDDRFKQDAYFDHVQAILNEAWYAEHVRRSDEIAAKHFAAAQNLNHKAPWVHYAYGLLLSRNQQTSDALEQFEAATKLSLQYGVPFFAPHRELIRHRVLTEDFDLAVHDCVQLASSVQQHADSGALGNHAPAVAQMNVEFIGRVMGFIKGPANNKTRTTVDMAAWENRLQATMASHQWPVYQDAHRGIDKEFADQLALMEQKEREFQERVKEMRDNDETRAMEFNGTVRRQRERHRRRLRTEEPHLTSPSSIAAPQIAGTSTVQNGFGGQQSQSISQTPPSSGNRLEVYSESRRRAESTRKYSFKKFDDPLQPWIREPFVLRTYLPEDFELRRLSFLSGFNRPSDQDILAAQK